MNWLKDNWFKLLTIAILLGASGHNPYSYYQFLRWIVCGAAAYTAYLLYEANHKILLWIFVAIAVLFNPIAPIYMSKSSWQPYDLATAIIFALFLLPFTRKTSGT